MRYDVHTHIMPPSYEQHKAQMLRSAELYGIDKVFVSSFYSVPNPSMAQVREANDQCYQFHDEHPDIVKSYVYISPELPNALDELKYGMEERGAIGVKLWMSTLCDSHHVDKIVEAMIDYDAPILIHAFHKAVAQLPFETTGEHVANIARRYPEGKFLMAHLGGNPYHGLPPVRDLKNVWIDMCSSIFRGDEMPYALEMVGEDRLLFGTDMIGDGVVLVDIGQVEDLDVSQEVLDKIFYKNAEALFGGRIK